MAVAVAFFCANLVGLGLGPIISGALSDTLASVNGAAEGLRMALMVVAIALLPGGALMWCAAQTLTSDIEE